ncbi:hypothetical protein A2U01_0023795, partial [Trifolium medium]|nr:hypothetical protein [Trifolium medium]
EAVPQQQQPVQPLPLDALTFSAWTTLYSNLEYLYRLYIAASYERPLPIQAVGSNLDIRFNVGNFMFQVAADRVQNEGLVTDRRVVLMSTIIAMAVTAFLGFVVNALKKNN